VGGGGGGGGGGVAQGVVLTPITSSPQFKNAHTCTPAPLCVTFSTLRSTLPYINDHCASGLQFKEHLLHSDGRDSSVGVAAGRYGDRITVAARFSAHLQTGSGVHPASYTIGTGSLPELERPGRDVDHPHPSSADVKERVELYLCSPSGPSWPILG